MIDIPKRIVLGVEVGVESNEDGGRRRLLKFIQKFNRVRSVSIRPEGFSFFG